MKLSSVVRRTALSAALALGLGAGIATPALAAEGWYQKDGAWRYEQADGTDATGWLTWANKRYYLAQDGRMATGWKFADGAWRYFGTSGAMKTGWAWDGTAWFYLGEAGSREGAMYASEWAADGSWLGSSGAWVDGVNHNKKPSDLTILHTNDVHGYNAASDTSLGTAAVAQLKHDYQAKGGDVLLMDAGDNMQGNSLVNMFEGMSAVEMMNAAGYDVMAVGNHEFDYGLDNLLQYVQTAKYPVLSASVTYKDSEKNVFNERTTFELKDGTKVGVFGLTTPETKTGSAPRNVVKVNFAAGADLIAVAQRNIDALRAEGCDLVVGLGHLGEEEQNAGSRALDVAAGTSGLDLFIDAHDHQVENQKVADLHGVEVPIFETGSYLANIGVVSVNGQGISDELVAAGSYDGSDAAVAAVVQGFVDQVTAKMSEKVGTTAYLLDGSRPAVRIQETNLGDLCADALLTRANAYSDRKVDAAIVNGGGIRTSIQAGDITLQNLNDVFPFKNEMYTIEVTGAQLLEALEASTSATPDQMGAFPQVAGITYELDLTKEFVKGEQYPDSTFFAPANPGTRVTIKTVGDEAFDPQKKYVIAVSSFMAEGGDSYYAFKAAAEVSQESLDAIDINMLTEYVVQDLKGEVPETYAQPQGRITIVQ